MRLTVASVALALALLASRPANALGPIDVEIAGKLGYGSNFPTNFGFGGRAGVSFFGLYGGLNVVEYPFQVLTYGGEVGYGIKVSILTIRPLFGFGDAAVSLTPTAAICASGGTCPSLDTNYFYVQPGGLLELAFGHLILGVDAAAFVPTVSGSQASFTMNGEIGVKF